MLRVSWTELHTNVSILQELGVKQCLSSFVPTLPSIRLHLIERLVAQGKGTRGRSPMRCTNLVNKIGDGALHKCLRASANRGRWWDVVKRAKSATLENTGRC